MQMKKKSHLHPKTKMRSKRFLKNADISPLPMLWESQKRLSQICIETASFRTLCALDLTGAQATRANINGRVRTVNDCLHLADVGLPGSVGLAVRVGNVVTKSHALAANAAICHFDTS